MDKKRQIETPAAAPPRFWAKLYWLLRSNAMHVLLLLGAVGIYVHRWRASGKLPDAEEVTANVMIWASRAAAVAGALLGAVVAVGNLGRSLRPPAAPPPEQPRDPEAE